MSTLRMEPHYSKDRKRWNQAWERSLKSKFALRRNYIDAILDLPGAALPMELLTSSAHLVTMQSSRDELVNLERDLTSYLNNHTGFEGAWQAAVAARREELILEGLVRSCDAVADMEDRRVNCPETCLDFLQRDNGRGFIDLANALSDPPEPEPRIVPHPAYDALIGVGDATKRTPAHKVLARMKTITRNFFLAMMVWNTVLAFHGESENYRAEKRSKDSKKKKAYLKKTAPEVYKESQEDRKGSSWACKACGMMEDLLPPGKRLMTCGRCNKLGRYIKYCDKDCQKKDWPKHKLICGKDLDAKEALDLFGGGAEPKPAPPAPKPSTVDDDDGEDEFPDPVPPFTRSRHLKHQIKLLKENPQMDYLIVQAAPLPDYGLMLQNPMGKMMFMLLRRRALREGNAQDVLMMYKYIGECAKQNRVPLAKVKDQLSLEYGIDRAVLETATLD